MDEVSRERRLKRRRDRERRIVAARGSEHAGEWRPEPVPESGWARVTDATMLRVHEAARRYYRYHPGYRDRWHDAEIEGIASAAAKYDPDIPGASDFDTYAVRIASNKLMDMYRRIFGRPGHNGRHRVESRQRSFTDQEAKASRRPDWGDRDSGFGRSVPDHRKCLSLELADAEAFEALVRPLGERAARIMRLMYLDGLTGREVGAMTPGLYGKRCLSESAVLHVHKDSIERIRTFLAGRSRVAWTAPTNYYPEGNDGPDAAA